MTESLPEPAVRKPGWRMRADSLREQLQRSPQLEGAIESLSMWFDLLRRSPYNAENADERLRAAFASETDNPVAWCAAATAYLPPEVETSLSSVMGPDALLNILDSLLEYVLGRACMRCLMARPSDTSGLSLAYGLLWPTVRDGISYAGADDELLERLGVMDDARAEIVAEARRLGENPGVVVGSFGRDRTAQAIQNASTPESLEACTNWQIRDLPINLHFGRIIQAIGSADAPFAAILLETIRNPALVASVLGRPDILSIQASANLLRSVGPIFGPDDRWTRGTTAWMVLLDIEAKLSAPLQEQARAVRLGAPRPPDPGGIVKQEELDVVAEALLARADGPRLALEWLAHLLWSVLLQSPPSGAGGDTLSDLDHRAVLLNALAARFRQKDWANTLRVWMLFGGSPLVAGANGPRRVAQEAPLLLPLWRDWLGRPNALVPVAVAVQLCDDALPVPTWLPEWVTMLCRDLEGYSFTLQLADTGPAPAAGYLAWPLVRSSAPSERFKLLWSDATWQLTRARFSKLEDAADRVRPCAAIIRIGLRMLEWAALVGAEDPDELAWSLADAIDEVRYTLPEIGLAEWSTLVGILAGSMAGAGLLKDGGCRRLLARYVGDDNSLAAAAVNAVANGMTAWEVRQALASIGEDVGDLTVRWETWNERFARDGSGKPSAFLGQLLAVSQAAKAP